MSGPGNQLLTPEQYLEIERAAERKSEYYQGEMFAMAGATEAHNLLVWNLIGIFRQELRSRPEAVIELPAIRCRVALAELYENVEFTA